jgi:FtsZ-binding cell division protein ZapB
MTTNPDNAKPHSEANATMVTNPGYAMTPAEALETPKETQENTKTPFDEAMELYSILLLKIDSFRDENEDLHDENQNLRDETQDLCGKNEDLSDKLRRQSQVERRVLEILSLRDENEDLRGKNEDLRDKLKVQEDSMPQPTMLCRSMQLARRVFVFGYKGSKEEILPQVLNNAALTTTSTPYDLCMELCSLRVENDDLRGKNEDLRAKLKKEDLKPRPPMLRRSMKLALLLLGVCVFLIFLPPMITPVHRNALETPAEALETAKKKQQDGINVPTYEAMDIKTPADEAMELLQAVLHHSQLTKTILKIDSFVTRTKSFVTRMKNSVTRIKIFLKGMKIRFAPFAINKNHFEN